MKVAVETSSPVSDGRSARRERNRLAVVEAALELMDEGNPNPSVEEITERSGVSPRSVFRYFEGLGELRAAVLARHLVRLEQMIGDPSPAGPLEARLKGFVNARIRLYQAHPNPTRLAWALVHTGEEPPTELTRFSAALDAQVSTVFAPELKKLRPAEAADTTSVISSVVSFDAWDRLVNLEGRSVSQVRRAWTRGVSLLLGAKI